MLELVRPSEMYLSSVIPALEEYRADNAPFQIHAVDKMIDLLPQDFCDYQTMLDNSEKGIGLKKGWVKNSTFWLVDDGKYVGTFSLRHELTPKLTKNGGHIAYQIMPSQRNKGYAKKGLALCLAKAAELGLEQVMISCRKENTGSYKVAKWAMTEFRGLEAVPYTDEDGRTFCRFWVKTRRQNTIRPLAVAIIRKGNKVLANKGYDEKKKQYFYRLPGGGINFFETAENTLIREFKEENNLDVKVGKKLGVVENLFEFNGKKGHEIIIVFEASLSDDDMKKDKFQMVEPQFEGHFTEFVEICPENRIYPAEALNLA